MKCTAHRSNGEPCNSNAMKGKRVCYKHGGATPVGIASPHFKTGKYSKYLPKGLVDTYADVQADENLLSVRGDIQLVDVLIRNKLGNLDYSDSAQHWEAVSKSIIKARKAYKNSDIGELEYQLDEMEAIADRRRLHYATEQELIAQLEQRRKMVDTEQKIILGKQQAITSEQAMLLVSAMLNSVRLNVTDATAINRIQTDFIQFIGGYNRQRIEAGSDSTA